MRKKGILKTLYLIGMLFLCSCVTYSSYAPKSISGMKIAYYTTQIEGPDTDFLHHNVVYTFDRNGKYYAVYQNEDIDSGDYSYVVTGENEARLITTYSTHNNLYHYASIHRFSSPTTGTWHGITTDDPRIHGEETGTFKILSN